MSDLITKLVPILHVEDPDAERRFYEQLGLHTTYQGPEYPGFIAVGNDAVEFGLSRRPGADPAASGVTWQLGVSDVDAVITACQPSGSARTRRSARWLDRNGECILPLATGVLHCRLRSGWETLRCYRLP